MTGHDHHHHPGATADNQRNVFWAMVLTGGFMLAEVVGGVVAGSLALIADAGHMLTDAASKRAGLRSGRFFLP
jgi:cobalt-zinc-cadmium efflux system protein